MHYHNSFNNHNIKHSNKDDHNDNYRNSGIYILKKIRNFTKTKIQNCETLPKLNISIYSKFGQHYRHDITMYDFIHVIQFLIPIWSWISKMMVENVTFSLSSHWKRKCLQSLAKTLPFSVKTMPTTWYGLNSNI